MPRCARCVWPESSSAKSAKIEFGTLAPELVMPLNEIEFICLER